MTDKILSAENYEQFKKELAASGCRKCALWRGRKRIVVDRGNPEAKILFIGEAPGENEDLQGRAFVGRAGKLLDQMLAADGFDTDCDSLIINVVKCRPPKNRAPLPEEAAACRPFFKKQIEFVRPERIGLLGATAFRHLFPEKRVFTMRDEVGRFFEHPGYPGALFMTLYHPAYILRDPRKKPAMQEHLRRFVGKFKCTESAGGVVVNRRGEVLVVSQHGNSWSLPKGHIDPGENALEAAEREIFEESGVRELTFLAELGSYERYRIGKDGGEDRSELKKMHFFLFRTDQEELKPADPHNPEARWVAKEKVTALLTHEKDKEFFKKIIHLIK